MNDHRARSSIHTTPVMERIGGQSAAERVCDMKVRLTMALLLTVAWAAVPVPGYAQDPPSAEEIMRLVNERERGASAEQRMEMILRDKGGRDRVRDMKALRKSFGDERRTVLVFTAPANIEGTALLTFDYKDAGKTDDQWLYLPAMRKVRRIPASEQSDPFLGSDFTYRDMNAESRTELSEHTWKSLGREDVDGVQTYHIEAVPINGEIQDELGYAKAHLWVDADRHILLKSELFNEDGNVFKQVYLRDYREVDGILAPFQYEAKDTKSGHSTVINVSELDLDAEIPDDIFSAQALERGL